MKHINIQQIHRTSTHINTWLSGVNKIPEKHLTQIEQNQKYIDELVALMKEATIIDGCSLCDGTHPRNTPENAILCRHHRAYVHADCCSEKCSWHGAPCRHAIIPHS